MDDVGVVMKWRAREGYGMDSGHVKTHGHVKIMMDSGGGGGRRCPFSRGEGGAAERDAVLQDEAGRQQGSESR